LFDSRYCKRYKPGFPGFPNKSFPGVGTIGGATRKVGMRVNMLDVLYPYMKIEK
jgi:hypothetical protein